MGRRRHRDDDFAPAGNSEFGYRVPSGHWASRLAPYAGEWAGGLGLFGASEACHLWLGHSAALPGITPVVTLLLVPATRLSTALDRAASAAAAVRAAAVAPTPMPMYSGSACAGVLPMWRLAAMARR